MSKSAPAPALKAKKGRDYSGGSGGGRSRRWCFTYNNYELPAVYVPWITHRLSLRRCIIGHEVGANGTRHLQGNLEGENQLRLSTLKEVLPSAHWDLWVLLLLV